MVGRQVTRRDRIRAASPALLVALLLVLLHGSAPVAHAAPPSNDDRTGATPMIDDAVILVAEYDLAESTTAPDDPAPCAPGGSDLGSIWFTYTPTASGPVILMVDANNETAHELQVQASGGTELGCAVAEVGWPGGTIDLDVTAGETYLLEVVGPTVDSETVGRVVIEGVATISLEPPTAGHINAAGDVEATFEFECSTSMTMEVGMELTQGAGASLVRGSQLVTVNCFAPSTSVTLTAAGTRDDGITSAAFRAGAGDWRYDWNAMTYIQQFSQPPFFGTLQLVGGDAAAGPTVTVPPTDVAPSRTDADGRTDPSGAMIILASIAATWAIGWPSLRRSRSRRA